MESFYSTFAAYANPSRSGYPRKHKIEAVKRQINFLRRYISTNGKAFQVGCSDGYTLHCFSELGWEVSGIDPSSHALSVAKKLWGLELQDGFFEHYEPKKDEKYDLILLTHILEHMYNPIETLKKCKEMLAHSGSILVEVPVLKAPKSLPPGYFSFEHLNYFSEQSLINMLDLCGLELQGEVDIALDHEHYPVITCIAVSKNDEQMSSNFKSDYRHAADIVHFYRERENEVWKKIDDHLAYSLQDDQKVVVWGAGIHTSQLFVRTNIENFGEMLYVVDSDPQKVGLKIKNYEVKAPNEINNSDEFLTIVISSHSAEKEIYKMIVDNIKHKKIIRLYE
jgi:hypothetical protein